MNAADVLEQASGSHREAIAACAATIREVPASGWTTARTAGKWTPAEIAEHLRLAYGPPLSELGGGPGFVMRLPWWKRGVLRWKLLPGILRGEFPKGAPAPKETRPAGHSPNPQDAARRLTDAAEEFLNRLNEAARVRSVRLTHAYFGKLSALQVVGILTTHALHHRAQLPGGAGSQSDS